MSSKMANKSHHHRNPQAISDVELDEASMSDFVQHYLHRIVASEPEMTVWAYHSLIDIYNTRYDLISSYTNDLASPGKSPAEIASLTNKKRDAEKKNIELDIKISIIDRVGEAFAKGRKLERADAATRKKV